MTTTPEQYGKDVEPQQEFMGKINRLHTPFGAVDYFAADYHWHLGQMPFGLYEKPIGDEIAKRKYLSFLDIGAELGYHSLHAWKRGYDVTAIEAHPLNYGFCAWNLRHTKANVIHAACGTGKPIFVPDTMFGLAGIYNEEEPSIYGGCTTPLYVPFVRLDAVLEDSTLVKIDVEGNELDVVKSAGEKIYLPNVTWIIETHDRYVDTSPLDNLFAHKEKEVLLVTEVGLGRVMYY